MTLEELMAIIDKQNNDIQALQESVTALSVPSDEPDDGDDKKDDDIIKKDEEEELTDLAKLLGGE